MARPIRLVMAVAASLCAMAALFPRDAARAATSGTAWSANGATACEKYLTPAVTGAILKAPAGKAKPSDATSCSAWPISLSLQARDVAIFRQEVPRIAGAHLIDGIGDAAYWNEAGALSSVKGDRGCDMSVVIPGSAKVNGAALAQELGAICNQLFALP